MRSSKIKKLIKKHGLNISEEGMAFLCKIFDTQLRFVSTILDKEKKEDFMNTFDLK
jgi:hypothetical protein